MSDAHQAKGAWPAVSDHKRVIEWPSCTHPACLKRCGSEMAVGRASRKYVDVMLAGTAGDLSSPLVNTRV
jgi:hypothetical protein